ncbi:DUF2147 domain-containing protein [Phreatobacter sp.]|uniref:DUF2147 domain-containing protein n=1 Tax=Phreatobacter sp. TaxID=1966341 RepID=UPI0022C3E41C|nr:DUF2147 domain-containing protein [Phreatobacter sp.]MCZ8314845.1 DUF2147 domain-containing protein [Phreatobacter sp.]
MKTSLILAALASLIALPAAAQSPTGTFVSQSGDTRVRFADCGGQICGTIVAARGQTTDEKNENASLRSLALVGVRMITMRPAGANAWEGSLYNFQDGKTYSGRMTMPNADSMSLSGCVLGGLVCRSQTWTRVN